MKIPIKPLLFFFLLAFSYSVLDKRIALFVQELGKSGTPLSLFSTYIPDLLFSTVCVIMVVSWAAFFYLDRKSGRAEHARFFLVLGVGVPVVFILKSVLKFVIGRISTKYWLLHPGSPEFHWFHGSENYSGFPSGHMAVFAVLVAALWHAYPRYRYAYLSIISVLAASLIITDYHFLSDVIAGTYLGLMVNRLTCHGLTLWRRSGKRADKPGTR